MKEMAIEVGFRVVFAVLLGLATWAINRWASSHVSAKNSTMLITLARSAIGYAEEAARKALKQTGQTLPSSDKLLLATQYARQFGEELVRRIPDEALRKLIEAELPEFRANTEVLPQSEPAVTAP